MSVNNYQHHFPPPMIQQTSSSMQTYAQHGQRDYYQHGMYQQNGVVIHLTIELK